MSDVSPRVERWDDIRQQIDDILPGPNDTGIRVLDGLLQASTLLEEVESLWVKIPATVIRRVLSLLATKQRKDEALRWIIRWFLWPGRHATLEDLCSRALTQGIRPYLPKDPIELRRTLEDAVQAGPLANSLRETGLSRHLRYRLEHLRGQYDETPGEALRWRRIIAKNIDKAIQSLHEEWEPDDRPMYALQLVIAICELLLLGDDRRSVSGINANYMEKVKANETTWDSCRKNTVACEVFGEEGFRQSESVLLIKWSTTEAYKGFWVPVFAEHDRNLPGAPKVCTSVRPQAVFVHDIDSKHDFGPKVDRKLKDSISKYFSEAASSFKTFISFPVLGGGDQVIGVVNVNVPDDALGYYDRDNVETLWHHLCPVLKVLSLLAA